MTSDAPPARGRPPVRALAAGLMFGCLLGFVALYLVADHTAPGQRADELAFRTIYSLVPSGWPVHVAAFLAREAVIAVLPAAAVIGGLAALARRRWRPVVRACVTVAGSVAATPYLRDEVLTRQPFTQEGLPLNSLPSTHASAAAALVVAVVLLWPRVRPWWLANAAWVVLGLVALGNIVGQAHRPSDVAGSFLLVLGLTAGTYALTGVPAARGARKPRDR